METLSFILGIAFVVVIAIAVVAVYAFVKVRQIKEELNDSRRDMEVYLSDVHRRIDETGDMVSRILDSRLDKLETRLTNKK